MKKLEYFNTAKGQLHLRNKRYRKRMLILINQEPVGKKSRSKNEKIYFQQEIYKTLQIYNRRAFRSPLIIEINFYSNIDNPPSIHNLAKTYLDILVSVIPESKIKRKNLLYKDDNLIKILIVNYILGIPKIKSSIHIEIDTFSNFIRDLELFERIRNNNFIDYDLYRTSYNYSEFDLNNYDHYGDSVSSLNKTREKKSSIIEKYGRKIYEIWEEQDIKFVQEDYLKSKEFGIDKLLTLFSPLFMKRENFIYYNLIKDFEKKLRELIISPKIVLDLYHAPYKEGETKVFKKKIKEILYKFKKDHPVLFPLRTTIGITILYVPPKDHSIDLDNLARYIIPLINEIMKPPSTPLYGINFNLIDDPNFKQQILDDIDKLPKIPRYSITNYQILEIPRTTSDPAEGFIRLIFGEGLGRQSFWQKLDDLIEKWEDNIKFSKAKH